MQQSLARASKALATADVHYCGPAQFRAPHATLQARFGFAFGPAAQSPDIPVNAALAQLCNGAEHLVMSEENFIGRLNKPEGFLPGRRYAAAQARISALARAIGRKIDVFMSIRHPVDFMNAAYGQMLISGGIVPPKRYRHANPLSSVDWCDLATRLRGAPGVNRLVIWRYEDYADVFPQLMTALVGHPASAQVRPVDGLVNPGLSARAIADILHKQTPQSIRVARDSFPVGDRYPAFDGYDAQTRARADLTYAAQVRAIAGMAGVTLLRPDPQ